MASVIFTILLLSVIGFSAVSSGIVAYYGQFPFMAAIGYYESKENLIIYKCGGSVISKWWVLTSAQCVYPMETSELRIVVGQIQLGFTFDIYSEQVRYIFDKIIHPNFTIGSAASDIAVLSVSKSFGFNHYVNSVYLPPLDHYDSPGNISVATGWGSPSGEYRFLGYSWRPILNNSDCSNFDGEFEGTIPDSIICAGMLKGNVTAMACKTDMGSPLLERSTGIQIGVSSYVNQCDVINTPSAFTNVTYFMKWITETTGVSHGLKVVPTIAFSFLLTALAIWLS